MEKDDKLRDKQKKRLEEIRKEFENNENLKDSNEIEINTKNLIKEFHEKFLKNNLEDLTLETYAKNGRDYFLYWLESKTNCSTNNQVNLGNAKPGTMNHTGLWFSENEFHYLKKNQIITEGEAEKIFIKEIKPFWINVLNLIKNNKFKEIEKIKPKFFSSRQFIIKFINLIEYNKYLLITNDKVLKEISKEFNIKSNSANIFELFQDISNFFKENLTEIEMKNISRYLWNRYGEKSNSPNQNKKIIKKKDNQKENKMETKDNNEINNILQKKKQIILYGPPGTGKTYNTKNIIYNFLEKKGLLETNNKTEIDENYKKLEEKGRVKFITFHQSYAYEEFIEGLKPKLDEENSTEIEYEITNGIFKEICEKAKNNYLNSKLENIKINFKDLLELFANQIEDDLNNKQKYIIEKEVEIENILRNHNGSFKSFILGGSVKSNQRLTKEIILRDISNFIENKMKSANDIKPTFESKNIRHGNAIYYFKLYSKIKEFYYLKLSGKSFLIEKEDLKPYFLIIDEINRGNISKILGELITLLEADKRLGEENELIVDLPYSKEKFGIPPNLYIIATMNTADKSIANLDIALRRRFGFVEMPYNSKLLKKDYEKLSKENKEFYENEEKIKLDELLERLNLRIEYLLDKDHCIGHSYFMKVKSLEELKEVFYSEIIPLLEEYFYGNYDKLRLVLGSNLVIENEAFDKNLFEEKNDFDNDETKYKIDILDMDKFEDAIKKIINIKSKTKEEIKSDEEK